LRIYKAQLPYFSERFRCITFDGRGDGKSGLVGLSFGGTLACIDASHPAWI
jgi:hypothetical protein